MATEPLLNFEELLAPLPGDNPAGETVSFDVRTKLEEARKEVDPNEYAADDPRRPSEPKYADWPGIVRLTTETLTRSSKDLLTAARLTEGLTKLHGFAGLADGLHLLRRLIEECWERIYPSIEDGDLEVRAGPFNWLGESDRGARFPPALRTLPLVIGSEGGYTWLDWRQAQEGKSKKGVTREAFDKAVQSTTREQAQEVVEVIARATAELHALSTLLTERLAAVAPGMSDLRTALAECSTLAEQIRKMKGPAPTEEAPAENGQAGPEEGGGGASSGRGMATRADIYQRLSEAANMLERMEPHSPIPYLVRKAIELGALPFPQLMKALIREEHAHVLVEMNRELGIKEELPPG